MCHRRFSFDFARLIDACVLKETPGFLVWVTFSQAVLVEVCCIALSFRLFGPPNCSLIGPCTHTGKETTRPEHNINRSVKNLWRLNISWKPIFSFTLERIIDFRFQRANKRCNAAPPDNPNPSVGFPRAKVIPVNFNHLRCSIIRCLDHLGMVRTSHCLLIGCP